MPLLHFEECSLDGEEAAALAAGVLDLFGFENSSGFDGAFELKGCEFFLAGDFGPSVAVFVVAEFLGEDEVVFGVELMGVTEVEIELADGRVIRLAGVESLLP